jgi:hypothetical protein
LSARALNITDSTSRGIIPEIGGKCDPFDAFAGNSAKYLGYKASKEIKKGDDERTEKDLQCQAKLCGGEKRLKAFGSVAIYFAELLCYLTTDIHNKF